MAKIRTQLIIVFLLIGFIPVATIGYLSINTSEQELYGEITHNLESIAQEKSNEIVKFLDSQEDKVLIVATKKDISNEELSKIVNLNLEFHEIFVLNSEGMVISSSDIKMIGLDRSADTYFTEARTETYIKDAYFSTTTLQETLAISTPYQGGVLVGRINLDHLSKITVDRTGLKVTGETYLINQDKLMITPSRFKSNTFLRVQVNTFGSEHCFEKHLHDEEHRTARIYLDYRGGSVLGSHSIIKKMNWCLLTEINEKEAFAAVTSTRIRIAFISGIFIFIILILAIWYAHYLAKPLKKLTADVDAISKGDLNIQLESGGIKEIQVLTDSLTRVLASMKLAVLSTGTTKKDLGIDPKKVNQIKEEVKEKYKTVFNYADEGMVGAEAKTKKIIFANKKMAEIMKYSEEELTKMHVADMHPKKDTAKLLKIFEEFAKKGGGVAKNIPLLRKDKSIAYYDIDTKISKIAEEDILVGFFRPSKDKSNVTKRPSTLNSQKSPISLNEKKLK